MKKYHKNYKMITEFDENGKISKEISYEGDYYRLYLREDEKKTWRIQAKFLSFCVIFLFFCAGVFNSPSSREIYIVIPYICVFLPAVYLNIASWRFHEISMHMRFEQYDKSVGRSCRSSTAIVWLSAYIMLADTAFILFVGVGNEWKSEAAFLLIIICIFIQSYNYRKKLLRLKNRAKLDEIPWDDMDNLEENR